MDERWKVGRIIARPYVGKKKGEFVRTANRHDLALKPFGKTVLDSLKENQIEVIGIGKIPDILWIRELHVKSKLFLIMMVWKRQ